MYNLFDKVLVLDKGVCIYFGPANQAKPYFEELGFECERRKSMSFTLLYKIKTIIGTPDFLTGITNPNERKARARFEDLAPKTAAEMPFFPFLFLSFSLFFIFFIL